MNHSSPRPSVARIVQWLVCLLGLTFSGLLFGQGTALITGRVLNPATGEYLRNATVTVAGTALSTTTETGGLYTLVGVPAGEVKLVVTYTGLDTAEVTVAATAGGSVQRDIELTSAAYNSGVVSLGEFVVATEREGNARALQDQKASVNMKKVVATDIFGDISEGNVGEFLKLMPGVTMDYVEADARTMSVRGLDPKYAAILMDGMPVASAFSSNLADGNSRAFEFEQVSIASIETIEFSKTPTPDVAANAVAGVVNLRGRGAFDRKGRQIRWSTSLGFNEYINSFSKKRFFDDDEQRQVQPNASLNFSDVYLDGKLGIQAGLLISNAFAAQKAIVMGYRFNNDVTDNATEVPRFTNFNYRDGPKFTTRENLNVRLDYKFSDDFWVYLRTDLNDYDATFHNRDLFITVSANNDNAATLNSIVNGPGSTNIQPGVEYSNTSQTVTAGNVSVGSGGSNRKYGSTVTHATGLNFRRGAFQATADFSISVATNHYRDLPEGFFNGAGAGPLTANIQGLTWTRSPGGADITITQNSGTNWRDETQWVISTPTSTNFPINSFERNSRDRRMTGKADFRYTTAWSIPTLVKWGLSSTNQERYNKRDQSQYRFLGVGGGTQQLVSNAGFIDPVEMTFDFGGNVDGIRTTDRFALADLFHEHPEWFVLNAPAALDTDLRNKINLEERIDGVYLQTLHKFFGGRFDIAPGVRAERTSFTSDSFRDIGRLAALAAVGLPSTTTDAQARTLAHPQYLTARYGSRFENEEKYDDVFAYLHTNFRVNDATMVRASYHEGITRPDPFRLIGQVTIGNEEAIPPTLNAGNPDLVAERSRNLNFSVEYYPASVSALTVTWFRSDLDNIQESFVTDLGPEGYDGDPFFDGWRLTTHRNGGKSHRTGLELDYQQQFSFLPGPLAGLSGFANYTKIRYDRDILNRPGQLANAGLSYRWGKINGNVRLNWTGTRRNTNLVTSGFNVGRREYTEDRLQVDMGLGYRLTRRLNLFVNGRNIFNEHTKTYAISPDFPIRIFKTGALWTVGIDGNF